MSQERRNNGLQRTALRAAADAERWTRSEPRRRWDVQGHRNQSAAARVGRFLWHFVQMVLVMNAGMTVYHALYGTLPVPIGIGVVLQPYPAIRHILMDLLWARVPRRVLPW